MPLLIRITRNGGAKRVADGVEYLRGRFTGRPSKKNGRRRQPFLLVISFL